MVMFDRQPMWNNDPGSSINERNNKEFLRRAMNFLAQRPNPANPLDLDRDAGFLPSVLELLVN